MIDHRGKNVFDSFDSKKNPFASFNKDTKGRVHQEKSLYDLRGCYAHDRDRILHSTAFRRLQGKTQVFISTHMDHRRTRLTHTLEVAQIAKTIARIFMVDEDLTEAIALAHDLGHPPYGHAGEDVLNSFMHNYGGFNHNIHSLRIVVDLERSYPAFDGLNLTWECIEGIVKHNGPILHSVPTYIDHFTKRYGKQYDLRLKTHASFEGQVAAIADDVAYMHHDVDDGFRAGLFSLKDLQQVACIDHYIREAKGDYPTLTGTRLLTEGVRRLLSSVVTDIVHTTEDNIQRFAPKCADDIRTAEKQMVCMSEHMRRQMQELRAFLMEYVYRSKTVNKKRKQCCNILQSLLFTYDNTKDLLPKEEAGQVNKTVATDGENRQKITDYIAGMTDRYADNIYEKLKDKKQLLLKTYQENT